MNHDNHLKIIYEETEKYETETARNIHKCPHLSTIKWKRKKLNQATENQATENQAGWRKNRLLKNKVDFLN